MTLTTVLSPGMAEAARNNLAPGMSHTYTLTPTTPGPRDIWAQRPAVPGTATVGNRCRYIPNVQIIRTDAGWIQVTSPSHSVSSQTAESLTVPYNDPIKVGDLVSDVRALPDKTYPAGQLIIAGPIVVTAEVAHAGLGPVTLRMLILRGHSVEQDQ